MLRRPIPPIRKAGSYILSGTGYFQQDMRLASTAKAHAQSASGNKYRSVVFDMGGVLVPAPNIRGIAEKFGVSSVEFINRLKVSPYFIEMELGKIPFKDYVDLSASSFEDLLDKDKYSKLIYEAFACIFDPEATKPYTLVQSAVKGLKADGLKVGLLTNNGYFTPEKKDGWPAGIDKLPFDAVVESRVEGIRKPNPKIFSVMLDRIGTKAEETIFIDDIGDNLKSAKALGFHTIKAVSPSQIVADLESLLNLSLRCYAPGTITPAAHLRLPLAQFRDYLNTHTGVQSNELPAVRQFVNGRSNPTYLVSHGPKEFVTRRKPPGKLLPSAHMIDREFQIYSALKAAGSGVPCPHVYAYCADPSVIGSEFFVMDYIKGSVFKDPTLEKLPVEQRKPVYSAMNKVLASIHTVDVDACGLGNLGKREGYMQRNLTRWIGQYEAAKTAEHPEVAKLIDWLKANLPKDSRTCLVHGDFRIDNLIYDAKSVDKVLAVLDWELATLGDPLTDLATSVFHYFIPSMFKALSGMSDVSVDKLGLPRVEEQIDEYFKLTKFNRPANFNFYVAYVAFRYAAIAQGVYKRSISGQSASPGSEQFGQAVPFLAKVALKLVEKSAPGKAAPSSNSAGGFCFSPDGLGPKAKSVYEKLASFISTELAPLENELVTFYSELQGAERFSSVHPRLEELKAEAKSQGLWNLWISNKLDPEHHCGAGLSNLEYAFMAELMGRYAPFAAELFNCDAPDTGNMEVLIRFGSAEQKKRWLDPLLRGEIRSAFAMTEPAVASSDATNISASICREGDDFVINGRKWWTSGVMRPNCQVLIFLGRSDSLKNAPVHRQHTMLVIPRDLPGIKVLRPLTVYGYDDGPHGGHGEVEFDNVRVPVKESILLDEGAGFAIGQGRLGPGRIHHCMRLIGMASRAIDLTISRAKSRVAFGEPMAQMDFVQQNLAHSIGELEQARLLVLKTAHLLDTTGTRGALKEIALIKAIVPSVAGVIIDRAIQIHGGGGLSQDFPLAAFASAARALRLADGPDEVHWRTVARMALKSAPPKL